MQPFRDYTALEFLTKELVDYPDDVRIVRTVDERGVLLSLHVHKNDMGKVIGVSGKTAEALRHLLRAIGVKNSCRVNLKIVEPPQEVMPYHSEAQPAPEKVSLEDIEKVI